MGFVKRTGCFLFLVLLFFNFAFSQEENSEVEGVPGENDASTYERKVADLRYVLISDFESAEDWHAVSTSPLGETRIKKVIQRGPIYDIFNRNNLTPKEKSAFKPLGNHILGVKTYFKNNGFDRVEIRPHHEYILRGSVKQVSLWSLGRSAAHDLYVNLRGCDGKVYRVLMGSLDYVGWRKLTGTVPGWLPQPVRNTVLDCSTRFVSIVVESDHFEPRGVYYFYIDQLVVRTDKSDLRYPGVEIRDNW